MNERDAALAAELPTLRARYAAYPNGGPALRVLNNGGVAGITTIVCTFSTAGVARRALTAAGFIRGDDNRFRSR